MSAELSKTNVPGTDITGGAVTYSPLREMLGYDPFRRFFTNIDPQIDVMRTDKGFDVEIPVPGFKLDEIDIVVKDDVLTISAKSERRAFKRSLKLPDDIDAETIEASAENGLLSLQLSRHPEAQPRKIEIKPRG